MYIVFVYSYSRFRVYCTDEVYVREITEIDRSEIRSDYQRRVGFPCVSPPTAHFYFIVIIILCTIICYIIIATTVVVKSKRIVSRYTAVFRRDPRSVSPRLFPRVAAAIAVISVCENCSRCGRAVCAYYLYNILCYKVIYVVCGISTYELQYVTINVHCTAV